MTCQQWLNLVGADLQEKVILFLFNDTLLHSKVMSGTML